jgi:hypothetical protein
LKSCSTFLLFWFIRIELPKDNQDNKKLSYKRSPQQAATPQPVPNNTPTSPTIPDSIDDHFIDMDRYMDDPFAQFDPSFTMDEQVQQGNLYDLLENIALFYAIWPNIKVKGLKANWWTDEDAAAFKAKTDILVKQFDAIEVLPASLAEQLARLIENTVGALGPEDQRTQEISLQLVDFLRQAPPRPQALEQMLQNYSFRMTCFRAKIPRL